MRALSYAKRFDPSNGILALLVTAPFALPLHTFPFVTFYVEMLTFALAALLIFFARKPLGVPLFALALPGFAAYQSIQYYSLSLPYWQQPATCAAYVLMAFCVIVAVRRLDVGTGNPAQEVLLPALAAGGFVVAIEGYVQFFHLITLLGGIASESVEGMVGSLGQRNMFAAYVACGIAALLSLRLHWAIVAVAGITMAVAEAYSGARIAWVLMALTGVAAWRNEQKFFSWCALYAAFAYARLDFADGGVVRATNTAMEAITSRTTFLEIAWRIWNENLIFGTGFSQFALQSFAHAQYGDAPGIDRHAHNVIAQLLAEFGLLGLGVLGAGFLVWSQSLLRSVNKGALAVLMIIGSFSFTEFPLWHAQFLALAAACFALTCPMIIPQHTVWRLGSAPQRLIGALALASCLLVFQDYRKLESFFQGNFGSLSFESFFRPQLDVMAIGSNMIPEKPSTLVKERALAEKALHVFPQPGLICRYAAILERSGDSRAAEAVWHQGMLVYRARMPCKLE